MRPGHRSPQRHRRLFLEPLESRSLLATIIVTSLADEVASDGQVTLREALQAANTNASVDGSAAGQAAPTLDKIVFAEGLIGTISLVNGELSPQETVAIEGPGPDFLAISGGSGLTQSRVFAFRGTGANTYVLSGVTVKDGNGKGVNEGFGGAINFFDADDKLTVINTVIRDSSALTGGTNGGGLFADSSIIDLTNVTVTNNFAQFGGGLAFLEVDGSLTNVTISENTANTRGGGLLQFASRVNATSHLRLIHSTVTGNISPVAAGLRNNTQNNSLAATLTLGNTIVANNTGGIQLSVAGVGATIVSLGNNLSSDASGNLTQSGDQQNADPRLGPLVDNGGGMPTHALLPGSPALNAGSQGLAKTAGPNGTFGDSDDVPLATDQRGIQRTVSGSVDIGAVEQLFKWHNQVRALDVVGSGNTVDNAVVSGDALAVINYLNAFGSGPVPATATAGPPFLDTNNDDFVTSGDVLSIINFINAFGSGLLGPEGEGEGTSSENRADDQITRSAPPDNWLALLATDLAIQGKRKR